MTRTVWSMVALAAFLLGGPAAAAVQAGVSAAVRGEIDLLPVVEKVKRQVASGEDVFLGDEISSFDKSGMQLMLLDETVFTIGPNTDLTVDEFVYDPVTGAGRVTASLAKGVLRFVTGKVAEASPQSTEIKLPVGTIGIRGTIGAVSYDGERALVVLLGPGPDNSADAGVGRLDVTAGGVTVELARTRFGTIIEPGQPPTPPFELSDAQLASILVPLAPEPAKSPETPLSVGTATSLAEQDTAEATIVAAIVSATDATGDEVNDTFDAIETSASVTLEQFTATFAPSSATRFNSSGDVIFTNTDIVRYVDNGGLQITSLKTTGPTAFEVRITFENLFNSSNNSPYLFELEGGGTFNLVSFDNINIGNKFWVANCSDTLCSEGQDPIKFPITFDTPNTVGIKTFPTGFTGLTSATMSSTTPVDFACCSGNLDDLVYDVVSSPGS